MNKHGNKRNQIPKHIKEWIGYNSDKGYLYWIKDKGINVKAGQVMSRRKCNDGYPVVTFEGRFFKQHRVVYFLVHGTQPWQVRFKDKNKGNIRVENLRAVIC